MLGCVVIGSGPAGISCALTLQSLGVSFRVFGPKALSEKIWKAEQIHNYPGLADVSGADFANALQAQLSKADIVVEDVRVVGVYAMKDRVLCELSNGETVETQTVALCVGVGSGRQVTGEAEFLGRGVSYCATCDGFLYKDKTIAVVSTNARFEEEVKHLVSFAKKVYFTPIYKGEYFAHEKVELKKKAVVKVDGERRVQTIAYKDKDGEETVAVDGVFFLKDVTPPSSLCGGLQTEEGQITVDRQMRTNLRRVFAGGDCTGRPYQYAKAVGEGNIVAHSVAECIANEKK